MNLGFYKNSQCYLHAKEDLVIIMQFGGSDLSHAYYDKNFYAVDGIIVLSNEEFALSETDYNDPEFEKWVPIVSSEFYHSKNEFMTFLTESDVSNTIGDGVKIVVGDKEIETENTLIYSTNGGFAGNAKDLDLSPEDELVILERNIWDLELELKASEDKEEFEKCVLIMRDLELAGRKWLKLNPNKPQKSKENEQK